MAERISDDALVVRGGRNQPVDLERGTGTHPSGITYEGLDRAGTEGERVPGREILQGDRGDWPETPATI
jgi:hypothetical protein